MKKKGNTKEKKGKEEGTTEKVVPQLGFRSIVLGHGRQHGFLAFAYTAYDCDLSGKIAPALLIMG